eukprot:jgi/Bigna1/91379/estExt_fgenesh1_pg.C_990004
MQAARRALTDVLHNTFNASMHRKERGEYRGEIPRCYKSSSSRRGGYVPGRRGGYVRASSISRPPPLPYVPSTSFASTTTMSWFRQNTEHRPATGRRQGGSNTGVRYYSKEDKGSLFSDDTASYHHDHQHDRSKREVRRFTSDNDCDRLNKRHHVQDSHCKRDQRMIARENNNNNRTTTTTTTTSTTTTRTTLPTTPLEQPPYDHIYHKYEPLRYLEPKLRKRESKAYAAAGILACRLVRSSEEKEDDDTSTDVCKKQKNKKQHLEILLGMETHRGNGSPQWNFLGGKREYAYPYEHHRRRHHHHSPRADCEPRETAIRELDEETNHILTLKEQANIWMNLGPAYWFPGGRYVLYFYMFSKARTTEQDSNNIRKRFHQHSNNENKVRDIQWISLKRIKKAIEAEQKNQTQQQHQHHEQEACSHNTEINMRNDGSSSSSSSRTSLILYQFCYEILSDSLVMDYLERLENKSSDEEQEQEQGERDNNNDDDDDHYRLLLKKSACHNDSGYSSSSLTIIPHYIMEALTKRRKSRKKRNKRKKAKEGELLLKSKINNRDDDAEKWKRHRRRARKRRNNEEKV